MRDCQRDQSGGRGMDQKLSAAIEVLMEQLEEEITAVNETKKMINALRKRNGEKPLFNDVDLPRSQNISRPDIFYGKPFSTAAREFLDFRRRACSTDEILSGLEQGGFDFEAVGWKEKDRLRSLAISLAKNSAIFHRLPNGTFGLLSWYPDMAKPKKEKEKNPDIIPPDNKAETVKESSEEKVEESEVPY